MKKLLCVLMMTVLFMSALTVLALEPVTVSTDKVTANTGDTISFNVNIRNNTGMTAMLMRFSYDAERIKINSLQNGSAFNDANFISPDMSSVLDNQFAVTWYCIDTANKADGLVDDGNIMNVEITVIGEALNDEYPINIIAVQASDIDENDVRIAIDNGKMPTVGFDVYETQPGETINVPVIVSNNPGMSALSLSLSFDNSVLQLESVTDCGLIDGAEFLAGDLTMSEVKLSWAGIKNSYEDGNLVMCTFKVMDDAQIGEYMLFVNVTECIDSDENDIEIYSCDSAITVVTVEEEGVVDSGTMSSGINWYLYESGLIKIEGTGQTDDYSKTSEIPWYSDRLNITEILISDGITSIGARMFYGCINAEKASIPESVTSIGTYSFRNCDALTIYGSKGSYAETYATENDIPFINTSPEELKNMTVEYASTTKYMYFYVEVEDYSEEALVYAAIYDLNGKMIDVEFSEYISDDITDVRLNKNSDAACAKVFVLHSGIKPVTRVGFINLLN